MTLSAWCIDRPVGTTLATIGVALASLLAYSQLPVAALPDIDSPTMVVATSLPGASAATMVNTVTTPLERQLGQVAGVKQMSSVSGFGNSQVTLEFLPDHDLGAAEQDMLAAISAATNLLPKDLPAPPTFSKSNPADVPVITLAVRGEHVPRAVVDDFADSILAQKLAQVSGVGLVSLGGGQKPAVRIEVDLVALTAVGLTLEDVRAAVMAANVNQPKGNINGPRQAFAIEVDDQLLAASEFANVVLAYSNGAPLLLSQVAEVVAGVENEQMAGWANGLPATIVGVQRQPGANLLAISRGVAAMLPAVRKMAPPGVTIDLISDRTATLHAAITDVEWTLLLTVLLVTAVMYVFLQNGRATLLPMVVVPLSLLGTFGVMWAFGYSLNNLTLMALTIAVGFVVDDAIVMVENIARYLAEHDSPLVAAKRGAEEIAFTIVSLTASLVAVLIPLFFMGGVIGSLFAEFAVTLASAIVISAAWSLTITPMLAAVWLRREPGTKRGVAKICERALHSVAAFYRRTLLVAFAYRRTTFAVWLLSVALAGALALALPKSLFPQQDTGLLLGSTEGNADTSFAYMQAQQEALCAAMLRDEDVAQVASFVGSDATNISPNRGRISITLRPKGQRVSSLQDTMARLGAMAHDTVGISLSLQPVQDLQLDSRASRKQYQYTLSGPSEGEVRATATGLLATLTGLPGLVDVGDDARAAAPVTELKLDRDLCARLGVSAQAVDDTLYDAFGQRIISTMFTQLNQYRVILAAAPVAAAGTGALDQLRVRGKEGLVPLAQLVTARSSQAPWAIAHQGQFPAATVSFNLAKDAPLGQAIASFEAALAEHPLPFGVVGAFAGPAAAFRESLSSQPRLILAALLVVYLVLGLLYESYSHPLTILSTLPSAGLGALLALYLCGFHFDILAGIGLVLLIGIVKKNGILLVDFALTAEREQNMSPDQAMFAACMLRFRPITMTTLAALLGGLPLALGTGVGAELRRPLGVAMVGGLLVSQLLTLYTTPIIYLALSAAKRRLWGAAVPGPGGPGGRQRAAP